MLVDALNPIAWSSGQHEAAQSLAVAVTEAVITRHYSEGRSYNKVRDAAKVDLEGDAGEVTISDIRFVVAVAPIASVYTPWKPSWGTPPPAELSRHATVHHAEVDHYTPDNALIAILLQASVLRAFQDVLTDADLMAQD